MDDQLVFAEIPGVFAAGGPVKFHIRLHLAHQLRNLDSSDVVALAVVRAAFADEYLVARCQSTEGKRPDYKKAIVKLAPGETIEFFEG